MNNERTVEQKVGRQIQQLRKQKGYTQEQLAEMIDLSTNYLSDIERGKSFPRPEKLVAIMNTLGCSADDLFQDVMDAGYQVKVSRLADRLAHLTPENQQLVMDLLDVLLKHLPS